MSLSRTVIFSCLFCLAASPGYAVWPMPTATAPTAAVYDDVALLGDRFLATSRWGLELFAVSDDSSLRSLAVLPTAGRSEFLDVDDDVVAVSSLDGMVELYSVQGEALQFESAITAEVHTLKPAIVGNYLYLGGLESALTVYDISDLSHPALTSSLDFSGYPHEFISRNDTMFVAAYHGGVVLLDISDPAQPRLIRQIYMPDYVYGMALEANYLYVCAHRAGLYVIDLRSQGDPPVVGHYGHFSSARKALVYEYGLLVLDGDGSLSLIDIDQPSYPGLVWTVPLDFNCYNFVMANGFIFVANWMNGAKLLSIEGKQAARKRGLIRRAGYCKSISLQDDRVFAAGAKEGLFVFDPELKLLENAPLQLNGNCLEVETFGKLAFLSTDEGGLQILDIASEEGTANVSVYSSAGWVRSSCYSGEHAFLANWQGIVTVNLEDPYEPLLTGFLDTRNGSSRIKFRGDTVFVAGSGGLELYDVSEPEHPFLLSRFATESPSLDVALSGDRIALCSGLGGVDLLGLANGLSFVSHVPAIGRSVSAELVGDILCVAELDSGVNILDVSVAEYPQALMRLQTPGKAYDLVVSDDKLYVADYYGVAVFQMDWPQQSEVAPDEQGRGAPGSLNVYPNPFNQNSVVIFSLPERGRVEIELFDILGRRVATVFDGTAEAGETRWRWQPGNVAAGCYLLRLRSELFSQTKLVTILK